MSASASLLISAWIAANPSPAPGPAEAELEVGSRPQAIYGGGPVEPGAWPAVVSIVTTNKRCTGTLVSPSLVFTAAHCFSPSPTAAVQIRFGDSDNAPTMAFTSDDWGAHEDFCLPEECGEDLHDFAWIRLPQPVDIEPILPITDQAEFDEVMVVGQELIFVGYGQTDDGSLGDKHEVVASLTSFNESGREFRAGGEGKDTCFGDSGGPALVELSSGEIRLAGVISRGGECGEGGIYGVPMPELCWLRDSSGIDLLPEGCDACDCVVLAGDAPDEGCDCDLGDADPDRPWWILTEVGLLFAALLWLRRGRLAS